MADQPHEPAADTAAGQGGAAPPTAEDAQAQAAEPSAPEDAPEAVAGEEVESAEEVLPVDEEDTRDYKDLYLRGAADMDNLRKRARRDVGAAEARGVGRLAKELLPAIDNLERAILAAEAAGESSQDVTKGLRLVQAELVGALNRGGIVAEHPKGQPFDPHRHEALAQAPTEGVEPGVVVEVYQPGYVLGEMVLRAARVVVSA